MARKAYKKLRVVIAGANFGGTAAALGLPGDADVTVIDPRPFFEFLPNIHELVSGIKTPAQLRLSRERIIGRAGHRLVQERIVEWSPDERTLATENGLRLSYDMAVCAVGGVSNFFGTPGAEEHAFDFKSVDDCHAIGTALAGRLAAPGELSVVIVGGGIEGVEALGEVLRRLGKRPGVRIHLIEGRERVLSFGQPGLHNEIMRQCRHLPVSFHLSAQVRSVYPGSVALADGTILPADMVIWTGGVTPPPCLADWELSEGHGQWARVSAGLQSFRFPEIFVVGDAAGLEKPLGKQAYHALEMGWLAAKNILRLAEGKEAQAFQPAPKPTLVAFGDRTTFLVADSFSLAGPALALAKEAVYQSVMAELDSGWVGKRALKIGARLSSGLREKVFPYALSPRKLASLGGVRIIR
ncbi:MAG: FAD-dependent oxidoreductase [Thermodesulfobacteriota bacterium]